jgi:polyphenol oxidase
MTTHHQPIEDAAALVRTVWPWGLALSCPELGRLASHLFTTRALDLRAATAGALSPWVVLAQATGVSPDRLIRLKQVHGSATVVLRRGMPVPSGQPSADIVLTDDSTVAVAVQVADCVPLLLADRRTGVVAAAHAGWRGTAAQVARVTVEALTASFGSRAADLVVAIGPSIGPCCYTVGDDVRAALVQAGGAQSDVERWVTRGPDGLLRLDLWMANRDQLVAAGVPLEAVHEARLCTLGHPELLFSYRGEGAGTGRMAGVIRMR